MKVNFAYQSSVIDVHGKYIAIEGEARKRSQLKPAETKAESLGVK